MKRRLLAILILLLAEAVVNVAVAVRGPAGWRRTGLAPTDQESWPKSADALV
jgi:hypothetical protein